MTSIHNWQSISENTNRAKLTSKWQKNTMTVIISPIWNHFKKVGKVKKLDSWTLYEFRESQRFRNFEVSSMLNLQNSKYQFCDWIVACVEKRILYDNRKWSTQLLDHDEISKHFAKPKLHHQLWWLSGGPTLVLSITAFWNLD